ncbi:MAG: sigma-70 family RNA polymerase sigma factor [Candidatus Eremiobacteraeota bacterium]|nr:sigma-70 family RNA polymerase sigma factor [Candidatus Eremiobacteraeota bacterium]
MAGCELVRDPDVGELLAHALADDPDRAFENVVRTYQDRIVSYLVRYLGDSGRAEEVAQDVFVRAYRALKTYDAARIRSLRLRSWLYAIASNLARNAVRGKRLSLVGLEHDDGRPRALADRSPSPQERAELREDWQRLGEAIERLSPKLRGAFVLRYVEELSYDEIAEALAQPVGTVKASAHRGLLAVRASVKEAGEAG